MRFYASVGEAIAGSRQLVYDHGVEVDAGHWQGQKTEGHPSLVTKELLNHEFVCPMPQTVPEMVDQINPNLPWADMHFAERVSMMPQNPDPSYTEWPWWRGQESSKQAGDGEQFTHTYSERFWPKYANYEMDIAVGPNARTGIRYRYGDMNDLVGLLIREPYTRQAYMPIFFPEDTGAHHGGRIPCTLGYHFMLRQDRLLLWYHLRSCDYVRHFRDDVYLAIRLARFILDELQLVTSADSPWQSAQMGMFHFCSYSFHYHKGDEHLV